jgi:hypothetical protein
LKSI